MFPQDGRTTGRGLCGKRSDLLRAAQTRNGPAGGVRDRRRGGVPRATGACSERDALAIVTGREFAMAREGQGEPTSTHCNLCQQLLLLHLSRSPGVPPRPANNPSRLGPLPNRPREPISPHNRLSRCTGDETPDCAFPPSSKPDGEDHAEAASLQTDDYP